MGRVIQNRVDDVDHSYAQFRIALDQVATFQPRLEYSQLRRENQVRTIKFFGVEVQVAPADSSLDDIQTHGRQMRQKLTKYRMITALARSTKKAETRGNRMKAIGAGPYRFVTEDMLAMAVGVAPRVKPAKPALRTAAV